MVPTRGFGSGRRRKSRPQFNWAEVQVVEECNKIGVELSRRGFPDFSVIQDGEIVGFIEVKPAMSRHLRVAQEAFKRMCELHGIPFARWNPGDPLPTFVQKVRLYQSRKREE